jgi:hypothetical protein
MKERKERKGKEERKKTLVVAVGNNLLKCVGEV